MKVVEPLLRNLRNKESGELDAFLFRKSIKRSALEIRRQVQFLHSSRAATQNEPHIVGKVANADQVFNKTAISEVTRSRERVVGSIDNDHEKRFRITPFQGIR